jgi:hypothetical protein
MRWMRRNRFIVERKLQHQGICDASGAIAPNKKHFVVTNDEDNILRVYCSDISGNVTFSVFGTDLNDYCQALS